MSSIVFTQRCCGITYCLVFVLKSNWVRRKILFKMLTRKNAFLPECWFYFFSYFHNLVSPSKIENFLLTIMCDVHLPNAPFLFCCLAILWKICSAYNHSAHWEENAHLCAPLTYRLPTMVTTYGCGIRIMADLQHRHLMTCSAWYKLLKQHPSRFSSQGSKCFKEWPCSAPARQPGKFLFAIEFLTSNRQYLNLLRT